VSQDELACTSSTYQLSLSSVYYVFPIKWGDILFLAPLSVCPSVFSSVRMSVRAYRWALVGYQNAQHMSICENFPFIPFVSYWVGFRLLGSFKQKKYPTNAHRKGRPSFRLSVRPSDFRVRSISFEPLVGFSNTFAQCQV